MLKADVRTLWPFETVVLFTSPLEQGHQVDRS